MAWYIDAVAELDELHARHCAICNASSGEDCKPCKIAHIVDFLESKYLGDEPTADVEEVVRCRACDFSVGDGEKSPLHCIHANGLYMPKPDDFCSFGERKKGEIEK